MIFMLVLFVILTSLSFIIATTKKYIEMKYNEIHKTTTSNEELEQLEWLSVDKLKKHIKIYWLMVETGRPQFIVARSVTWSTSELICFLTSLILARAEFQLYSPYGVRKSCKFSKLQVLMSGVQKSCKNRAWIQCSFYLCWFYLSLDLPFFLSL